MTEVKSVLFTWMIMKLLLPDTAAQAKTSHSSGTWYPPGVPGLSIAVLGQPCSKVYPWLGCPLSTWDCHTAAMGRFGI